MKFFLDTAHKESIEKGLKTGLLDGVTTNPTLLSKEKTDPSELIKAIAALGNLEVSVEVTETDPKRVYQQALKIAALAPNILVKIPCASMYLPIIKRLASEGIPLNITLVFSLIQGLSMAKLGVRYVSPFIGRLEDIDSEGTQLLYDLKKIFRNYGFHTQILAASIRTISHIHIAADAGVDCATIPVALFDKLIEHPLTQKGIKLFDSDWKKLGISHFP